MSEALARIELSRQRLRLAMLPAPAPLSEPKAGHRQSLLDRFSALPLISAVIDSVSSWWASHPLRPVAQVANEASNAVARPVAQRNPLLLVLAAGIVGAGLAWTRPWRWIFRSALFAGFVPQLASRIVSSLPIESWASMVGATMSKPRRAAARTESHTR